MGLSEDEAKRLAAKYAGVEGQIARDVTNTCSPEQPLLRQLKEKRAQCIAYLGHLDTAIGYLEYNPGAEHFVKTLKEQYLI